MTPKMKKIAADNFKKKVEMKIKAHQAPPRSKTFLVGKKRPRN